MEFKFPTSKEEYEAMLRCTAVQVDDTGVSGCADIHFCQHFPVSIGERDALFRHYRCLLLYGTVPVL